MFKHILDREHAITVIRVVSHVLYYTILKMPTTQPTPQQVARGNTFISKAATIHHNKFDYTLVDYRYASQKVKIICPVHGAWEQRPNDHLMGCGCPGCKFDKIASQKRHTVHDFIHHAMMKHGNTYDYSRVRYINDYRDWETDRKSVV